MGRLDYKSTTHTVRKSKTLIFLSCMTDWDFDPISNRFLMLKSEFWPQFHSVSSLVEQFSSRCQFHQHFASSFFVQKFFASFFLDFALWNWLQALTANFKMSGQHVWWLQLWIICDPENTEWNWLQKDHPFPLTWVKIAWTPWF